MLSTTFTKIYYQVRILISELFKAGSIVYIGDSIKYVCNNVETCYKLAERMNWELLCNICAAVLLSIPYG